MHGDSVDTEHEVFKQMAQRCSQDAPSIDTGRSRGHPLTHPRWTRALADDRVVKLTDLIQFGTYDGMLCGFPGQFCDEVEQRGAYALHRARERLPAHFGPPALLTPQRYLGEVERADGTCERWHRVGFVTTIAVFESSDFARDPGQCYSSLAAVWFQDTFGLPTDPWVLAQIDSLDWTRLAWDWTP
ncbi:hypothetical protein OPU71_16850 [Niveibacterium sp. 24ML]|uniref:hypothetical protein n=1 Tax=Niveibacterium sp. 24ML TaxID=2985512 RepID=UPI00226ECE03|nr:hypothetical protein [Niveibacterium sp. 24ML]MCX9157794.1 hypothetical protein [Niveibacterium sp. 24ML]